MSNFFNTPEYLELKRAAAAGEIDDAEFTRQQNELANKYGVTVNSSYAGAAGPASVYKQAADWKKEAASMVNPQPVYNAEPRGYSPPTPAAPVAAPPTEEPVDVSQEPVAEPAPAPVSGADLVRQYLEGLQRSRAAEVDARRNLSASNAGIGALGAFNQVMQAGLGRQGDNRPFQQMQDDSRANLESYLKNKMATDREELDAGLALAKLEAPKAPKAIRWARQVEPRPGLPAGVGMLVQYDQDNPKNRQDIMQAPLTTPGAGTWLSNPTAIGPDGSPIQTYTNAATKEVISTGPNLDANRRMEAQDFNEIKNLNTELGKIGASEIVPNMKQVKQSLENPKANVGGPWDSKIGKGINTLGAWAGNSNAEAGSRFQTSFAMIGSAILKNRSGLNVTAQEYDRFVESMAKFKTREEMIDAWNRVIDAYNQDLNRIYAQVPPAKLNKWIEEKRIPYDYRNQVQKINYPEQKKIINGKPYRKVNGGWQLIKE
jgi:hypothetical protein